MRGDRLFVQRKKRRLDPVGREGYDTQSRARENCWLVRQKVYDKG